MKKIILLLLTLTSALGMKASEIIDVIGSNFYVYEAGKGETLQDISEKNNWNLIVLQEYNPDLTEQIAKGDPVYYPCVELMKAEVANPSPDNKNGEILYIVKEGDTFKQIADAFNVSVMSIFNLNYGLTPDGFKSGIEIKVPEFGTGISTVTKLTDVKHVDSFKLIEVTNSDDWTTLGEQYTLDPALIESVNPYISNFKNGTKVAIPVLKTSKNEVTVVERDERENTTNGISEIYNQSHKKINGNSLPNLKVAIVAESPSSKKDLEFIRGFLAGIKKIKSNDYKISLKVVDGAQSENEVIETLKAYAPEIIISTYDKTLPTYLTNFAAKNRTLTVNAFDTKNEDYINNPFIIQLMAPASSFNENVARNMHSKYADYKLVMVGEEDENDLLAQLLKKEWESSNIKYLPTGSFEALSPDDIQNSKLLFYAYPTKKEDVVNLLTAITNVKKENPLMDYALLGRPNWILYNESLKGELQSANAQIPSRFFTDYDSELNKNFVSEFQSLYKINPTKSVPMHAASGYDIATYFLPEMARTRNDVNNFRSSLSSIQTAFDLKRDNYWSGLINLPAYLIQYREDGTITEEVIE